MPPSTESAVRALVAALDGDAAMELRRALRAHPELAHAEHGTARLIESHLGPPDARFGETGLVYRVGDGADGVVVRAELDALPGPDGPVHACGHDVHMAALAALVRAARAAEPPVPLWAVFQPSEEAYPSGAEQLMRSGLVDGGRAAVACHVHPELPWRALAASPGPVNAACDNFQIEVTGRGGHAAYPHLTADPVLALAAVIVALHAGLPRRTDPLHPAVVAIGLVRAGEGPSIVPGTAVAVGTLRTLSSADRPPLREALRTIAKRTAAAHGCAAEVRLTAGEPVLCNDKGVVAASMALAPVAGLTPGIGFASCGSDDFAFLGAQLPVTMAYLGLAGAPDFEPRPLHHPDFTPPDAAVVPVAHALAVLHAAASLDPPELP